MIHCKSILIHFSTKNKCHFSDTQNWTLCVMASQLRRDICLKFSNFLNIVKSTRRKIILDKKWKEHEFKIYIFMCFRSFFKKFFIFTLLKKYVLLTFYNSIKKISLKSYDKYQKLQHFTYVFFYDFVLIFFVRITRF